MTTPIPPPDENAGHDVRVPLFPLPNCVVFPNVLQPLHIFEPRYRQMTADVLAGDRLLAMALLKPPTMELLTGSSPAPDHLPAIFPVVCLGRITAEERLPDGRYFLVFRGENRAVIVTEETVDLPYRVARLRRLSDTPAGAAEFPYQKKRQELLQWARRLEVTAVIDQLILQAGERGQTLEFVVDMLAYLTGGDPVDQQAVLATTDLRLRYELVLRRLRQQVVAGNAADSTERPFPPPFSAN